MNVGFRPRLKARPSLYDLVRNHNINPTSRSQPNSFSQDLPRELPALPPSPFSSPPSTPSTTAFKKVEPQTQTLEPVKMAPKKRDVAKDEDGEEQYGKPGEPQSWQRIY
jgi:hypothetical protein